MSMFIKEVSSISPLLISDVGGVVYDLVLCTQATIGNTKHEGRTKIEMRDNTILNQGYQGLQGEPSKSSPQS